MGSPRRENDAAPHERSPPTWRELACKALSSSCKVAQPPSLPMARQQEEDKKQGSPKQEGGRSKQGLAALLLLAPAAVALALYASWRKGQVRRAT